MIMLLSVHTAVWDSRPTGALVVLVAIQLSVIGLYLPPVFTSPSIKLNPPHTIISLPVQTAVGKARGAGAFAVLVAIQLSVAGLYLPPVFRSPSIKLFPPHTIISVPVQTAVWCARTSGALVVLVAVQASGVHPVAASDIVGSVYLIPAAGTIFGAWFSVVRLQDSGRGFSAP